MPPVRVRVRDTQRNGIVHVIRMRIPETQWKCNSILREEASGPGTILNSFVARNVATSHAKRQPDSP